MNFVIFGLTISSSWGNGHATLWRGLCKALARLGHQVTFFERDVAYYAASRDWQEMPCGTLVLYSEWADVRARAAQALADADVAVTTSYCPDAIAAAELMFDSRCSCTVFYDLDTPVTLACLAREERVPYVPEDGLGNFDLVLSYTGGEALSALQTQLGARVVAPLYGHVDPDVHRPAAAHDAYRSDLSYLGTYAADRQATLERLFVEPARRRVDARFLVGGAQYPESFPWSQNIYFVSHVPPARHPSFFCSSRLTLNVTRAAMANMGWCPSGRLFEAAACGAASISDAWEGLDTFYTPGEQVLIATDTSDVLAALQLGPHEVSRIAHAARARTLEEHTSMHRALEWIAALEQLHSNQPLARALNGASAAYGSL